MRHGAARSISQAVPRVMSHERGTRTDYRPPTLVAPATRPDPYLAKTVRSRYAPTMTIALAKDVEDFLQEQVRAGVSSNPSELVNDVLRSVREQQQKTFEITPELEAWLLEAADKPVTPLTSRDFDAIRYRVQTRLKSSAK